MGKGHQWRRHTDFSKYRSAKFWQRCKWCPLCESEMKCSESNSGIDGNCVFTYRCRACGHTITENEAWGGKLTKG